MREEDLITTRTVTRSLVAAVIVCATSLVGASTVFGATPSTPYDTVPVESPNPEAQGRWGERSALAGDIDGDGVPDFFMSAFQQTVQGVPLAGRVYLMSGRTRTVIRSFASPEPQREQRFGFTVSSPGDLSGDGKRDVVISGDVHDDFRGESAPGVADSDPCGAPEPNGCYENTGQAWAFNGATGQLLYSLENPQPQSNPELPFSKVFGFGTSISSAGDLTGDGRPEVIVGAASNDSARACGGQVVFIVGQQPPAPPGGCRRDQGQAFIFNGATGALFRSYDLPATDIRPETCNTDVPGPGIGTCGFFGQTVQGVGDLDGDGVTDHTIQGGTYQPGTDPSSAKLGRIWVYSGRTGNLLFRIDNPAPAEVRIFALQIVEPGAPGDVNGDGAADIYGNGFSHTPPPGPGAGPGRGWIFSGRDGSILYNLFDPSPEPAGGFAFSGANVDYDGDGREDEFIVGQNGSGIGSGGGASLFGVPSAFGPTAAAPTLKDFQAPVQDAAANPPGPPPANGLRFGRTVEAPGDLNGDCEPDFVIGAPHTDVGANPDQGRVYVFLSAGPNACPKATPRPPTYPAPPAESTAFGGCPAGTANVIRGTAAANKITGTVRADRIFAGTGDDTVDALAGSDCVDLGTGNDRGQGGLGSDLMLGGRGNDRVSGSSGNDRIRGNPGNDRLDGGRGNDRVFGDAGNDILLGSFGNDVLHGVSGKDRISASRGRDRINGGSGNDQISGGSSGDRISGDAGSDRINGNSGADRIKGNSGNDRITSLDNQRDRVNCGSGRDSVLADRKDIVARNCERVRRR